MVKHQNGAGLKVVGSSVWYGPGYCGICGDRDVVPVAVRFYDPDDGWKLGVLCRACGEDARERGPRAEDYAVAVGKVRDSAARIDVTVDLLGDDYDGAWAMADDGGE